MQSKNSGHHLEYESTRQLTEATGVTRRSYQRFLIFFLVGHSKNFTGGPPAVRFLLNHQNLQLVNTNRPRRVSPGPPWESLVHNNNNVKSENCAILK